jgi:hypothetical protein
MNETKNNGTEFRYSYSAIRFLQATEQSSVGRSTWLPELCSGENYECGKTGITELCSVPKKIRMVRAMERVRKRRPEGDTRGGFWGPAYQ